MSRKLALLALLVGCNRSSNAPPDVDAPPDIDAPVVSTDAAGVSHRTVIVIPFENKSDVDVYGNTTSAPYINGLLTTSAYATNFQDELPALPSEPHYVWMEAGTNTFSDRTFLGDGDPTATNSTADTAHLSTQLDAAGLTWKAYQEDITAGGCPIKTAGVYAPKHDPFVFFRDVVGSPPSASNTRCADHHATFIDLAADIGAGALPSYAFITPDLCHDMHGAASCPSGTASAANVKAGDDWLAANLPALIAYTHTHDAVIFLTWDEGSSTNKLPFIVIGDHVVAGASDVAYSHSSQVATIEHLLGLPKLATVAAAPELLAMFAPGYLP